MDFKVFICNFNVILRYLMKFQLILTDLKEFHGISMDFKGVYWDFKGIQGVYQIYQIHQAYQGF